MANILLVTHWTGGDVFPFIRLGSILRAAGNTVTLFTHCYYRHFAEREQLGFEAVDTPEVFEEMSNDLILLENPIRNLEGTLTFNQKYHGKERLIHECRLICSYCDKDDTVIISRHRSSISGLLAAEKMRVPAATAFLAPNYLAHMSLHNQLFGKEMVEEINKARRVLGLEEISDWRKWLYSPKRFFAFWPDWFAEHDEDWPENIVNIGFVRRAENSAEKFSSEITQFLGKNRQVVLISGGSSKMVSPKFYQVAAEACEKAGFPAILVTYHDEQVPCFLPENILRVKNAPLSALMKKAAAIIHHGGMGTLSEAVEAGIPQIILPHLTDGPDNAQRLSHNGIARVFPVAKWDSAEIGKALHEVMTPDFKERCISYSRRMIAESQDLSWIKAFEEMAGNDRFLPEYKNDCMDESAEPLSAKKLNSVSKQHLLELIQRRRAEGWKNEKGIFDN